jgi:hypothetical protein
MTPADRHAAVLARLADLEGIARSAQPFGAWYQESSKDVAGGEGRSPLLLGEEHEDDVDDLEDWIFTAATRGDAAHIVAQQPRTVLAVLAGRRRIVERHAPVDMGAHRANPVGCPICQGAYYTVESWPCDDYRDAAADLLPEETT